MRIRWSLPLVLVLAGFAGAASPARAQDYRMVVPNYSQAYTIPRQNVSRNLRYWESERSLSARLRARRTRSASNRTTGGGGTSSRTGRGSTNTSRGGSSNTNTASADGSASLSGSTTFQPVAGSVLPALLAQNRSADPRERKEVEQFFDKLLDAYKGALRQSGVAPNDVARAASFMLFNSLYVYRDGRELTPQQMNAAREQLHEAFATDAQFQRRSNRDRQEIYESYAIMGMYLGAIYEGAKRAGDTAKVAEMRELARRQLEETLGAPVSQIEFTDSGIEYR